MDNGPIIRKLSRANVVDLGVSMDEHGTGKVQIFENCDAYYSCHLTKEEYIALAHEILANAEKL